MNFRFKEPRILAWMPLVVIVLLFLLWQSTPNLPVHNERFMAFGTLMDVSIVGVSKELSETAVQQLEKDFEQMHHLWHAWDPGPLGRVNQLFSEGKTFSAPTSVLPLIKVGQTLAEKSDHLFNPAIGKLVAIWGFHSNNPNGQTPPSGEEINKLLELNPRMSDIKIDGYKLSSDNTSVQLDFGAFGKGFGIDRAIESLKEMGIENAIINAGGDLRAIGSRDGTPWRIAIKRPSGAAVLGVIKTDTDESVFTSGDYERNYTYEGKRYHHIIDPRTGYPAEGISSVTVIHSDATTADAAATALFVAGKKDWHRIARQMKIRYVLIIDNEGTLHMNPAMQKRIELLRSDNKIVITPPLS
jgi:thiamine biosynthesis lipoprotein